MGSRTVQRIDASPTTISAANSRMYSTRVMPYTRSYSMTTLVDGSPPPERDETPAIVEVPRSLSLELRGFEPLTR